MTDQVWVSEVMRSDEFGDMPGLREKWFGEAWEVPYVRNVVPNPSPKTLAAINNYASGYVVRREEMPEASAIYSLSPFKKKKDFFSAGCFLVVAGRLAEVLAQHIFCEGGGLNEYKIFEPDEKTELPGPYYLVNFGVGKDCFLPDATNNIRETPVRPKTGATEWSPFDIKDKDVAVSMAALKGADIWMCPGVLDCIFMSNRLVLALQDRCDPKVVASLGLRLCRVIA